MVFVFEALPVPVVETKEDQLRCIGRGIILSDKLFLRLRVRVVPDDRLDIFVRGIGQLCRGFDQGF